MDFSAMYQSKLTTAEAAVQVVKSGDWVDYSLGPVLPASLDAALAHHIVADDLSDVNFRAGIAMVRPEVTKIPDAVKRITWNSTHCSGIERKMISEGFAFYLPIRFSELPRYYRENVDCVDVAMFQVAPMDKHGYFNFGMSAAHCAAMCERAKVIILEINNNMPVCLGGSEVSIHVSQVDMIVEGNNPPIAQMGSAPLTDVDNAVANLIVPHIPNGATIQLGIGGMPNAVGALIAKSDLKDLGIHSEMYVDSFVDMVEAGRVTGANKPIDRFRQVFTFAAGSQKLYDYIDHNPAVMAAPVDYVNDIRIISTFDNFISINNAVDVDLFGQVGAETSGLRHISGAGGQLDFVLGAYLSKGGKSFICCSSTVKGKDGTLQSRLRPTLNTGSVVTDTRANTQYLATEYGMVNLKGATTWQRAERIISIAHPDFRDELISAAQDMGIWRRSNQR